MSRVPFDTNAAILLFECGIEFKSRHIFILALDTGSSYTIISEAAAIQVGFDLRQVTEMTSFSDASRTHIVPKVALKSFSLAEAKVNNLDVLIYTLPEEQGIDGIIGLNFLRQFNIGLDFEQAVLTLNHLG